MKTEYRRQLSYTCILALSVIIAMLVAKYFFNIPPGYLVIDVTKQGDMHPLTGAVSSFGCFLWGVTASICGFAAVHVYESKQKEIFRFLLFSSLLSAYLFFDDYFMIHDDLAGRYLGIESDVVQVLLIIAVLAYLIAFRRSLLQSHYALCVLALVFLGSSVFMDVLFEPWMVAIGYDENLWEEGAKWLGITCWLSYFVRTSYELIQQHYSTVFMMPATVGSKAGREEMMKERKGATQTV
jgi:hypothetical protein